MNNAFIRKHINSFAIIIFLITYISINFYQPSFLYTKQGSLRTFGLGQKQKTVIPLWLISFILGILSYLFVLYYITLPKF